MSYTVPYTFVPGTKARAQEVNANFASILDTFDLMDENKVDLDLSNISDSGLDVIKNNSSVRNIGELIFSPIPIADANLHLLDGSLIEGNGIYREFVNYIKEQYNQNSAYNPGTFAIRGNPTITSDGIITSADSSNYAQLDFDFSQDHTFVFEFSGNNTNLSSYYRPIDNGYQIYVNPNNANRIILYAHSGSNSNIGIIYNEAFRSDYTIKLSITKIGLTYTVDYVINGTITGTLTNTLESAPNYESYIKFIGATDAQHSIDLKEVAIIQNGVTVISGKHISNFFTNEDNWQYSVANYGECAKFVYNSSANTVRLPKINGIVEATSILSESGILTEAGLPNITGSFSASCDGTNTDSSGAFSTQETGSYSRGTGGFYPTWARRTFDASDSSSIYGNSDTVQPQTVKYLVYIVLASKVKTDIQIDIDNIASDLNGKLNADLTNIQSSNVKNIDGQWINAKRDLVINMSANANSGYEYDLTPYLPYDGNKYEVLFTFCGETSSSAGAGLYAWAGTDLIGSGTSSENGKVMIAGIKTNTSSSQFCGGCAILPVGTGRKLYLYYSNSNSTSGINVKALGYRRIGTNS